ncbi:MAG: hypothetical protein HY420_00430 [Candidatus Kerfeldbacteria bacterium]|nr:hypothetical protein [Candidatus Kerfeldbacteria bacterium]
MKTIGDLIAAGVIVVILPIIGVIAIIQTVIAFLLIGLPAGALLFAWWRRGDGDVQTVDRFAKEVASDGLRLRG